LSRFRPSRNYITGEFVITGGPVDITGDLVVSGSITANQYNVNVINTNVSHIYADGSTKFGDTPDDTHVFTGSMFVVGTLSASSIIGGGATTPGAPATSVQYNDGGAFAGDADFVWDNTTNSLTVTGDITASSNISGAFFYGDGAGLTGITATAAPAGSNTEVQFNADGVTAADADFTWLTGSNTLAVTGDISGSGNVSGSFFYGDGSNLTNTPAGSPAGLNTQIQFNADSSFGSDADFTWASGSNTLTVIGDISASVNISGSAFYGNGANLTDLNASNVSAGTLDNSHLPATISVTNVTASALVSSSFFYGDGSNLINLPVDSPAGSNTQIQFNADGAFGADTDLVWASGSNVLSVTGIISASAVAISSSNPAETLLNISGYNFPNLLNVDASSSLDGGARVMIRNSNDDIIDPNTATGPRGVLHLEQDSTSSVAINSNGISLWTDADENYESTIRLHTWNPSPGNGSALYFYTNEGALPSGFVASGQTLGRINFGGQATTQTELGYFFQARASQTWNGSSINSSYLQFYSVPPALGAGSNIKERIRFTGEGHIIIFPYEASNNDADVLANNFDASTGAPALQVYGPTLFGSSSANTHIFTGSVIFEGDLSASLNISASAFYGNGANLTDLNASNISAGTLDNSHLPATISVTNVTASALVSSSFFYGDGSNLTNLPSAAITTYNSASAGRIITSVNATTVEGEPNLTFDNTTLVITGDVSGSGNISGSAFYGDGSNLTGLARDFGPSATDPVGSPSAGDFYYNTVLNMTMHYDSSRVKWLSAETAEIHFGRNGNTGIGAYYRGINGRSYSDVQGRYAEHSGTIVSFSYTRGDVDAAVFNVTSDGTTVSFLSSSALNGLALTLDDDFSANTVLGVRNQSADGNTTTDVLGVARMKWRI